MKEIKEDKHKWKDIPCSWIGRLTSQFDTIDSMQSHSVSKFMDINKLILKFLWKNKRPRITTKNRVDGLTLYPFQYLL